MGASGFVQAHLSFQCLSDTFHPIPLVLGCWDNSFCGKDAKAIIWFNGLALQEAKAGLLCVYFWVACV